MSTTRPLRRNPQARHGLGWGAGALVLLAALAVPVRAGEWQLGGKVGHYLFYGTGQGSLMQNEIRYQLSVQGRPGWDGQVYVLWKGTAPLSSLAGSSQLFERPPSSPWPSLDEAYADLYFRAADLRLGRQVVHWGTADGINPTDVVNPRSVSLDALIDREVRSLPVPAVRAALYLRPGFGLTAVGVADFVPAPFPEDSVRQLASAVATQAHGQLDTDWLSLTDVGAGSQYELALRAEAMVAGYNVYLSYFNGFEDFPALWMRPTQPVLPTTWRVYGQYRRQQQFGVAAAGTLGDAASVWAEAAYTLPEQVSSLDVGPPVFALSTNQGTWQAVVGGDYTFAGNIYVSGQLVTNQAGSLLLPYHAPGQGDGMYAMGLLRYSPQSSNTWDALLLSNLRDGGTLVAPGLTYELRPGVKLVARYLDVVGDDGSEFGRLRNQLRGVATRVEWSF